nr:carboxypeptidase B-like [Plodia interpunctella]
MKVLAILFLVVAVSAKHEKYLGWKSYYLGPSTPGQMKAIGQLISEYDVDVLGHPVIGYEGVALVKPEVHDAFLEALQMEGIAYRVHRDDVKAALDQDDVLIERRRRENVARGGREMPYDNYQPLSVIFHSREWVTVPVVTYAIHKLVEDVTEPDLLERFDFVILPVVNPDGYEFSYNSERFWRKTRSTDTHASSSRCPGVDGNRNYDFFWNTVGVSPSPCDDIYPGNRPFSEIETRVVRDIIDEYLHRMALYLTMHSFGSMILYPWGHDGTLSNNAFALHTVGIAMADAIHDHQLPHYQPYTVGNAALVLWYGASGAAEDYAHLVGVPLSYTYELPGFSGTWDGFHLAPSAIEQVAKDTWEGVAVGARRAGDLFVTLKK